MKNKYLFIAISAITILSISSCKKYLDELPDNRAELDNTEKISKMLVSAYPQNSYVLATELSSDNVDDYGESNPYSDRISQQLFKWEDVTETSNDGIDRLWGSCYGAIASANAALSAIEAQGNPTSLSAQRGEALVARAYGHFILVNVFAQHYSPNKSATDLGVTYMTKSETTLNPKYQRNTVAEVYGFMIKDIEEGLPLINDASYSNANAAKYHFNKSAANAFAARLFLYKGDWAKAVNYSSAAFNNSPSAYLRDWTTLSSFSAVFANMTREYNSSNIKANFLISTPASAIGTIFGNYFTGSRYSHGAYIAGRETLLSATPHGITNAGYRIRTYTYSGANLDKVLLPHASYQFEYTDPVAGIGYAHGVFTPFTAEEALLTRAEANIHLKNYSAAIADMQLFVNNTYNTNPVLTEVMINTWANGRAYSTAAVSTGKKKFNSEYAIEAGTQENMLHAVLFYRRVETLHTGLRWFDVKRYGIEITRRTIVSNTVGPISTNTLSVRDNRRALQLPQDVISSGLTANPR
ncbi:RagB/SusD family nutrient uptake outer membrane protein [Pedobacter aquatilis]|uniref:RagB/SusD family nutrient uptake outer membrane protein n=1 Tax=Pedobacter aquatilis TaxID=351343 RepID=UPI0025B46836|nr:RagB/SusD family nutrient uptake outer membrane protein [Pedobacter aquatilis]MDN3585454.1 RagB/SusD family nutrient uptake outer membrane protein [Pedobacter aquatilis]